MSQFSLEMYLLLSLPAFFVGLSRGGLGGGEAVVNHFDRLLFQNSLNQTQRNLLLKFVNTNAAERPKTLDPAAADYTQKVQELVGLILSMPQWQFQ